MRAAPRFFDFVPRPRPAWDGNIARHEGEKALSLVLKEEEKRFLDERLKPYVVQGLSL